MDFKNLASTESFKKIEQLPPFDLRSNLTPDRIASASIPIGGGLAYNWASMPIGTPHFEALRNLAFEQELVDKYQAVLAGEVMNTGEKRLVLHQLTRGRVLGSDTTVYADGEEKGEFYAEQLAAIEAFSNQVRSGALTGSTGKPFSTVVQIGIGGSDLGPRAMYLALKGWCSAAGLKQLEARFISNVDPDDAAEVLAGMDFETTLFILVTKSGTTQETLTNQDMVLKAMQDASIPGLVPSRHMLVVTSKTSPLAASDAFLKAFFIDDYIGGRYSSTSAVGAVVLALAFGFQVFSRFLAGAHDADVLALEPEPTKNAAMLDALIGVYLRNVLRLPSTAILPYAQALSRFPAHLQQLDMESNGKQVNRFGEPVDYSTGPVVFGEPGTNGQHSFYQLLHQGTDCVPLQFIGFKHSQRGLDIETDGSSSQEKLVANLIAQIVAFAKGKNDTDANKRFLGNRWSSVIHGEQLTPEALGALLAHYENKVMFQGFLWNVNSFDQEGVQLGKILAKKVLSGGEGDQTLQAYTTLLM